MKSLLCVLFLSTTLLSGETDFRSLKWGMTIDDVKANEELKLVSKLPNKLFYENTLAGIQTELMYEFKEGKLYKATYTSKESYLEKNDHIIDYNKLKAGLTKKYGTPKTDEANWSNELHKADEKMHGKAASLGHVAYNTSWENDRTAINMELNGSNSKCKHTIVYEAKNTKWNTQGKQEDITDDL